MSKSYYSAWKKLYKLLDLERKDILQVLYYAIFAGVISLIIPLGIQAIIMYIQGAEVTTSWILLTIAVTLGVAFVGILRVLQMYLIEDIQQKLFTRSAFEFTYRFPKMRVRELKDQYPPELANRFIDVFTLQKGFQKILLDFPASVLQIVFGFLLLSFYHPFFIAFGFILVILFYVLIKFTLQQATETSIDESTQKYKVLFWIQQVASQFKMLKLIPTSYELKRMDKLLSKYLSSRQDHFKVVVTQYKLLVVFKVVITLGLLLIGGLFVLNQQMNLGQFVAAEIIIVNMINSVDKIGQTLETIYDMVTGAHKISYVTDKKLDRFYADNQVKPDIFPLRISKFKSEKIEIEDLTIEENEILNLIGKQLQVNELFHYLSGMKKTTHGKIFLDKQEISSVDIRKYQSQISIALNSDRLFEGSIRKNIALDETVDEELILEQLEAFGVLEEIQNLPDTIETRVFSEIEILSDKAARMICLLRVLVKKPKLLLIEDGFVYGKEEQEALLEFAKRNNISIVLASPSAIEIAEIRNFYL